MNICEKSFITLNDRSTQCGKAKQLHSLNSMYYQILGCFDQKLRPNLARDILESALEALKVCTQTREMIMVAVASSMFARMRLRVDLAATPKHSLVELFCS